MAKGHATSAGDVFTLLKNIKLRRIVFNKSFKFMGSTTKIHGKVSFSSPCFNGRKY